MRQPMTDEARRLLVEFLIALNIRPIRSGRITFNFSETGTCTSAEVIQRIQLDQQGVAPPERSVHTSR